MPEVQKRNFLVVVAMITLSKGVENRTGGRKFKGVRRSSGGKTRREERRSGRNDSTSGPSVTAADAHSTAGRGGGGDGVRGSLAHS